MNSEPLQLLVQPRALVHRGTVEARALFFETTLIGEEAAQRRVLESWVPGAQVYQVAEGYLLRLAVPSWIACHWAPGTALTQEKGLLLSAPLSEDEKRALETTTESLVLVRGGAAQIFALAELKPIDVAAWLDVSSFETASLQSLGQAPPPPALLVTQSPFDVREKLGIQAAPELEKLLAQMQNAPEKEQAKEPFWERWLAALVGWWQSVKGQTRPGEKVASPGPLEISSSEMQSAAALQRLSLWNCLALLLIALGVMALTSLSLPPVDFSKLASILVAGLILYGFLWLLWLFVSSLFATTILATSSHRWRRWLPWCLGAGVLLLFFVSGNNFADLGTWLSRVLWFLVFLLLFLLLVALLIALLLWSVRQIGGLFKTSQVTNPQTSKTAPANDDFPLTWVIGSAALGVFMSALKHGHTLVAVIAALVIVGLLLYEILRPKKARGKAASSAAKTRATPKTREPSLMPPTPVQGPLAGLRNALARAAWMAGLWRIYGPIQARYVARLMDMFARGDLDNALRHAIPMGGAASGAARPAFGVPGARSLLEIFTGRQIGGSIIPMPLDIAEQLRAQYRAAFERLEAQGRHEEAAFVLAELLHASEEAVAYLERHGRSRLAAELAEGRDLPADLVVRQWLLAGDGERALWIARRKNAFYSAIARLEKGSDADKANAQKLRLLWANELARGGDYVAAVSAAWPVVPARHLVSEWMMRGLLAGGLAKARMLAWRCQIAPTMEEELRAMVLELLNDSLPEAKAMRLEFAQRLPGDNVKAALPVVRTLARPTIRALVRDAGIDTFNETRKKVCQELIEVAGDGALRADVPPRLFVSTSKPLKERETPLEIVIEASDSGALPLYDAAFLPDGRSVVALGEAGARLLSRDGRAIAHFDQPCHRFVLSDQGDRALALAPRGEAMRLAKLDFANRRAASWCETHLDACSWSYDGSLWFVAAQGSLFAIDTTAEKFGALWHTPEVGDVASIERSFQSCAFITRFMVRENFGLRIREKWERWQLEVPSLTLRHRTIISDWGGVIDAGTGPDISAKTVTPDGNWARLTGGFDKPAILNYNTREIEIAKETVATIYSLQGHPDWWACFVITQKGEEGTPRLELTLIDRAKHQQRLRLALNGARSMQARFSDKHLALCDDRGRLLVFDLERGALEKNFRLS